jgi:hypothetical protein
LKFLSKTFETRYQQQNTTLFQIREFFSLVPVTQDFKLIVVIILGAIKKMLALELHRCGLNGCRAWVPEK